MNWCGVDLGWAYSDLLRSIVRQTRCGDRAQDVLHDSLLRYVLTPKRDAIAEPQAYLRTVARSVLTDHLRDSVRYVPFRYEQDDDGIDIDSVVTLAEPATPSAEQLADLHQRLEALQCLLDGLPPRCREVFWLFRVEGYKQIEIASKLGMSVNMVERHVMRALIDLRAARELLS